jgi:predicted regulator of Ras-like GTPase activity (Roadblock/LC7/MglB family)
MPKVLVWPAVDPQQALADLTEISSQVRAAVLLDAEGALVAATVADDARARQLAEACRELLAAADDARGGAGRTLTQLEAATREGSVFVVREGESVIAATTGPSPTVGLVFYDLKTCLRAVATAGDGAAPKKAARRRTAAKRKTTNGDAEA